MKKIAKKLSISTQTVRILGADLLDNTAGGQPPVSKLTNCSYCITLRTVCETSFC